MAIDINALYVYRIIPIQNLEADLLNGFVCKNKAPFDKNRVVIGNTEIISERDKREVACYPGMYVNDFVPFYFSTRTPMLLNIKTGKGVPQRPQEEIVYLCFRFSDLATDKIQWCFTNGNAAKRVRKKHAEFLVKGKVPVNKLSNIAVCFPE